MLLLFRSASNIGRPVSTAASMRHAVLHVCEKCGHPICIYIYTYIVSAAAVEREDNQL